MDSRRLRKISLVLATVIGTGATCGVALYCLAVVALYEDSRAASKGTADSDLEIAQSEPIIVTADEDGAARVYRGDRLINIIRGHGAPLTRAAVIDGGRHVVTIDRRGESRVTDITLAELYHHADIATALRLTYDRLWDLHGRRPANWALSLVAQVLPLDIPAHRRGGRGHVFKDCDDCPEMVELKAGTFLMGSPIFEAGRGADESTPHLITISRPFALGRFLVTFDEWGACATDGGCDKPKESSSGERQPITTVSFSDAKSYVAWLSKKTGLAYYLPDEEEWEYAARAGTSSAYPWGSAIGDEHANCNGCRQKSPTGTTPVGSFMANPFGLYDMHGNVWEWMETCYVAPGAPEQPDCTDRVLRGGSWDDQPSRTRSAARHHESVPSNKIGFRVARKLDFILKPQSDAALDSAKGVSDTTQTSGK